jgi:DNA-directed RNA polymerase subunit RPC12/RpoP
MSDIIKALPILVIVDPDPIDPDEPGHTAQCPHCGAQGNDIVREIDQAVRWNTGELVIEDGQIVAANWGEGDTNFEHVRYECDHCGKPVDLPGDIGESFS